MPSHLPAIAIISDKAGPKPAVLMMDETPKDRTAATPDVQRLAKSGHVILIIQPRGTNGDAPPAGRGGGAAAQPTIHTFSITLIAPLIAPFHR